MDENGSSATLDNIRNDTGCRVALREAFRVWLRLAYLGFGGPAYQLAAMRRILVEEKRWISERRFLHALDFCLLLPGPDAQKLATYLGWLMHRTLGGIIAGGLLIAPGVASIMLLSYIYTGLGKLPIVGALFFGLRAALIAIILESLVRIGRHSLRSRAAIALAAGAFIGILLLAVPLPIIVLSAAALGFVASRAGLTVFQGRRPDELGSQQGLGVVDGSLGEELPERAKPNVGRAFRIAVIWLVLWLLPVDAVAVKFGEANVFSQVATFFSQIAMLSFGGSYAVFAYVAQQAVQTLQWLTPGELLDGLGMAQARPPPALALQFVAFVAAYRDPGTLSPAVAGILGSLLATWVTLTPCFLWVFVGAPFADTLRHSKSVMATLSAITAATVGITLSLAVWFSVHTIFHETILIDAFPFAFDCPKPASIDPWALTLSVAAALAIFRFKIGTIPTLIACCVAGVALDLLSVTP
jgi:chromate transporter